MNLLPIFVGSLGKIHQKSAPRSALPTKTPCILWRLCAKKPSRRETSKTPSLIKKTCPKRPGQGKTSGAKRTGLDRISKLTNLGQQPAPKGPRQVKATEKCKKGNHPRKKSSLKGLLIRLKILQNITHKAKPANSN